MSARTRPYATLETAVLVRRRDRQADLVRDYERRLRECDDHAYECISCAYSGAIAELEDMEDELLERDDGFAPVTL